MGISAQQKQNDTEFILPLNKKIYEMGLEMVNRYCRINI